MDDEVQLDDLYADFINDARAVLLAYDGDEALDYVDQDLDVALRDRKLKNSRGDELVDVIRERGIGRGIMMVTAVSPDPDIVKLPVDDYLTKPINKDEATIEEARYRLVVGTDRREFLALLSRKIAVKNGLEHGRLEESSSTKSSNVGSPSPRNGSTPTLSRHRANTVRVDVRNVILDGMSGGTGL